jgi:hypothetical protein
VSFICTFHDFSRTAVHDGHFMRHNCVRDYKFPVLEVGHEDQMQAFLTEGKEDQVEFSSFQILCESCTRGHGRMKEDRALPYQLSCKMVSTKSD